uniref:Uncharacterized protein n=1 Tax=Manihot esculenta TaxID=3983 RepID=A0A2C9VVT9_MANES
MSALMSEASCRAWDAIGIALVLIIFWMKTTSFFYYCINWLLVVVVLSMQCPNLLKRN